MALYELRTHTLYVGKFANAEFVEGFASRFRPLLHAAPWGPHP